MALAGLKRNRIIGVENPKKMGAVSRCFRAEVTDVQEGLFRVHEFTKVEMFAYCKSERSESLLEDFLELQKKFCESLHLHAQVLDMPENDLGLSASRKYDIEAFMPGHGKFGEISSASNCKDYQSSRLNISNLFSYGSGKKEFVHTVNGTLCAVPRLLIALLEQHQQMDGAVWIPPVLRQYFGGKEIMLKSGRKAGIHWKTARRDRSSVAAG